MKNGRMGWGSILRMLIFSSLFAQGNFIPLARGAAGDLDPSFDGDGLVTTEVPAGGGVNSFSNALIIQPDGKIVAAGTTTLNNSSDFALARYLPDGSLDDSFGTGGIVITDFPPVMTGLRGDFLFDIALQPDGKIVAVGNTGFPFAGGNIDVAMARYLPDGSLDNSFGTGGLVISDLMGTGDSVLGVALQEDGKIVVVGDIADALPSTEFFSMAARYLPDGSLDNSFGTGGFVITDFPGTDTDQANDVAVQPDGKIVTAGSAVNAPALQSDLALIRYNEDGGLDGGFGTGGLVQETLPNGSLSAATSVLIQPDGQILTGGATGTVMPLVSEMALVRFNPDGSLESGFGTGGVATAGFTLLLPGSIVASSSIGLLANGQIMSCGSVSLFPNTREFGLARFDADGPLDPDFGTGGRVLTDFMGNFDSALALAIQADGKVVVAGNSGPSDGQGQINFALARYLGDSADLRIVKAAPAAFFEPGEPLTYTLTVTNLGPDSAAGVTVGDVLPAGVQLISVDSTQGSCAGTSSLLCDLGSLANGGDAVVTITIQTAEGADSITNTATVTAQVVDPDPANNSSTVTVTNLLLFGGGLSCRLQSRAAASPSIGFLLGATLVLSAFRIRRRADPRPRLSN